MKRFLLLMTLILFISSGCALFTKPSDDLSFNRGKFFLVMYKTGKTYAKLSSMIEIRCRAGKLDKEFCDSAAKANLEFERNVEKPLLKNLADPKYVVDWDAVGEAMEIVGDLSFRVLKGGL